MAKLAGPGRRRVVVETHSDGVNALWDNGSVPILAIARYFATLPRRCRPGPMEFVLTTAHLYQRLDGHSHGAGDELYARKLDKAYDRGTVALVLALEHLGAYQWDAVPRGGGQPGLTLRRTSQSEPSTTFVTESPFLVGTLERAIKRRNVERSLLLKGTALADDSHVPPYCSFGGEGTPYMRHLIPTVGFIAAPWTLFDAGYGLEQIDFGLLRQQTLQFTDFLLELRGVLAGEDRRQVHALPQGAPRRQADLRDLGVEVAALADDEDRRHRAVSGGGDHVVDRRAVGVDDDGLVLVVELEDVRRGVHAVAGPDAQRPVDGDLDPVDRGQRHVRRRRTSKNAAIAAISSTGTSRAGPGRCPSSWGAPPAGMANSSAARMSWADRTGSGRAAGARLGCRCRTRRRPVRRAALRCRSDRRACLRIRIHRPYRSRSMDEGTGRARGGGVSQVG